MCADTTKCAYFLIIKAFYNCKHILERLKSHDQSVDHINATITFVADVINHYEELMQS